MTTPLVSPFRLLVAAACLSMLFVLPSFGGASKPKPKPVAEHVKLYNEAYDEIKKLRFASAQNLLEQALKLKPDFAEAHNNLAYTLRKQGEDHYDQALAHYNKAIELNAKLSEAYMYRGVLHVQMGNDDLAAADLETLSAMKGRAAAKLAAELTYVIENGNEKTPEGFFGVAGKKRR
ncbi:MAG: tetratricopeptide repeat protein [Planctomycetota bacterium]